jgi:uncharacterized protein CbrC (UPF0167 family)
VKDGSPGEIPQLKIDPQSLEMRKVVNQIIVQLGDVENMGKCLAMSIAMARVYARSESSFKICPWRSSDGEDVQERISSFIEETDSADLHALAEKFVNLLRWAVCC